MDGTGGDGFYGEARDSLTSDQNINKRMKINTMNQRETVYRKLDFSLGVNKKFLAKKKDGGKIYRPINLEKKGGQRFVRVPMKQGGRIFTDLVPTIRTHPFDRLPPSN